MNEESFQIIIVLCAIGLIGLILALTKKSMDTEKDENSNTSSESSSPSSIEDKLDKIYDVMNHIRWIGLSIGGMFVITFMLPQCTGG